MLKPSAKELVREKATHQVPVFFLERELYPFWLSPPHFLVLIDGFGYTPLEERCSDYAYFSELGSNAWKEYT